MSFTIKPDGTITVDTVDELKAVLSVRAQVAGVDTKVQEKVSVPPSARELPVAAPVELMRPAAIGQDLVAAYRGLYEHSSESPQQQKLLRILVSSPVRMYSDDELRAALGLGGNVDLRGLLIGIVRRANTRHLPNPIVKKMIRHGRAKRSYSYGATGEFRRAMEGWLLEERLAV